MNYIKGQFSKHSKLYLIILSIISISITLGLIVSLGVDNDLSNNIYKYFMELVNNYNTNMLSNFLYPILSYIIIIISSLTIIGIFIPFLALFIENMSIGLLLGIIIKNHGFKGFLFSSIYFTLTKLLYLIILIYIIINIYNFYKIFILYIKNKKDINIYKIYSKFFIRIIFSIITITLYNILGIFIIPKIIKLFIFLL